MAELTTVLSDRRAANRLVLWSALLIVHALMLAGSYAWVVAGGGWQDASGKALAWCAFIGLLAALATASSSLAFVHLPSTPSEASGAPDAASHARTRIWVALEILSLAMLSFCAAILVYKVSNAG